MLAFDLSSTPLAASTEMIPVPRDFDLCAILNALLAVDHCPEFRRRRRLMLGEHNLDEVTRTIHTQFPLLFQRATGEPGIRNYLTWFTGLTVEVGLTCSGEHQDPNPTTSRTDEPGPDAREVASGTPLLWADDDRLAAEGSGALETAPRGAARRELRR